MVQRLPAKVTAATEFSLQRLISWARKGSWSLVDQWLFSGANLISSILLARWLAVDEYGAYALVFSIFLFFNSIYSALVTEPMLVLGAGRLQKDLPQYIEFLLQSHVLISLTGTALLLLVVAGFYFFRQQTLLDPSLWVAGGLFFLLLPWLLRRLFYLKARADLAALSSALYFVFFVGAVLLLRLWGTLSSSFAFGAMAAAGLFSCLPFASFFQAMRPAKSAKREGQFTQFATAQWSYAKWSLPSAILIWIPLNIFYLLIPYASGLQGAASFKAISNLINPLIQSNGALTVLLLPQLSRVYFDTGKSKLLEYTRALALVFLAASLVYLIFLFLFGPGLIQLLYGAQYQGLASLMPWVGLLPPVAGLAMIFASSLRAMERPNEIFKSYVFGAVVAMTIGALLTVYGTVPGAIAGQILAHLAIASYLGRFLLAKR